MRVGGRIAIGTGVALAMTLTFSLLLVALIGAAFYLGEARALRLRDGGRSFPAQPLACHHHLASRFL